MSDAEIAIAQRTILTANRVFGRGTHSSGGACCGRCDHSCDRAPATSDKVGEKIARIVE